MVKVNIDYTIIEIEKIEGIVYDSTRENEGSLPQWYKGIRRKKLSQLSDGDLARMIRQDIYIEYILYEYINRLYKNPFCGEQYDGELIYALAGNISKDFWNKNSECKKYICEFLRYLENSNLIDKYDWDNESERRDFLIKISQLRIKVGSMSSSV